MEQTLSAVAQSVTQFIERRQWDSHRVFSEGLIDRLCCHYLLMQLPDFAERLWIDYRPWPDDSNESIRYWVDGDKGQKSFAFEVRFDDPNDDSPHESEAVWSNIIADILRMATAIEHSGLGVAYVLLFGELRYQGNDPRLNHVPMQSVGESKMAETDKLLSHKMDSGFFEELKHPHELVPAHVQLELMAAEQSGSMGFWIWQISLPENRE